MQFTVPADHPCLPGHFPGDPLVPGVVILDRVVEAAAMRSAGGTAAIGWEWPQVKFLQPLRPGQVARVVLQERAGAGWRFEVWRGESLLARGELRAVVP